MELEFIPQNKCYWCELGRHDECDRKEEINGCMVVVVEDNNDYGEPRSDDFCTCWACHGMFEKEDRLH